MAFLNLVTGVRDLRDAQSNTRHFILKEMTDRISENLNFRKDKQALASLQGEDLKAARENARFFSSVEGLFALNQEDAIDGLYVQTKPRLKLVHI